MCLWAVRSYIHTSPPKERKSMLPFQFINNLLTPKNRKQRCFIFSEKSQWSIWRCTHVQRHQRGARVQRHQAQQETGNNSNWDPILSEHWRESVTEWKNNHYCICYIRLHATSLTTQVRLIALIHSIEKILLYLTSVLFVSKSCLQLPVITVEMTI